jgi:integrase
MTTNMENRPKFHPNPKLKLMEQVREVLRYHHYAYRTEQTYSQWIIRFIHFFGGKTHPKDLGSNDVERFLSDLAVRQKVSASTQRQALNALVFLYREVLDKSLDGKIAHIRSKKKPKTVTVLSRDEVSRFFRYMDGTHALMAKLLYGSGLRLMECVRLRIKDIDFERVKALHHADLEAGFGEVYLPSSLGRKYTNAAKGSLKNNLRF